MHIPESHTHTPKQTHTTMSDKLHQLEQQWEAFQKSTATTQQQTTPHVNQLHAYQQLQQNVNAGFAEWEKEHQDYQKQLDECTQRQTHQPDASAPPVSIANKVGQMSLKELIDEHQCLTNQLESLVQSATDIKHIMELWTRFDIVHTALTQRLQTQG